MTAQRRSCVARWPDGAKCYFQWRSRSAPWWKVRLGAATPERTAKADMARAVPAAWRHRHRVYLGVGFNVRDAWGDDEGDAAISSGNLRQSDSVRGTALPASVRMGRGQAVGPPMGGRR